MSANHPVKEDILARYTLRTPKSRWLDKQAKSSLPGGDTRWAAYHLPYPVYMTRGEGCTLTDADGNRYYDFQNNYTSLVHGHAHPEITAALQRQAALSAVYGAPAEGQFRLADLLTGRLPGVEQLRFTNSGTEASMMAMRAARAYTGREVILKMDGGYHGSHDLAEVNITPDLSANRLPIARVEADGVPQSVLGAVAVARFNDLGSVEEILHARSTEIAAVIVEPVMNSAGMITPDPGFLPGLRALADRYSVLLIFDEVVTLRLHPGGYQGMTGVTPDLTALGKLIGGGLPIGAFGGRAEIMHLYDPAMPKGFHHSGTFNGNPLTMAAGIASVEALTPPAIAEINRLGAALRQGMDEAFTEIGMHGYASGEGSLVYVHWTAQKVVSAVDVVRWKQIAAELPRLLHLELLNRGIFSANRGMFNISTPMNEEVINHALEAFRAALFTLKPYVADIAPHLLLS
jgi:glutamate-1-semialdehyde 2,1-aminomutase